jgi:uncharacterized Zn-finger protein
MFLDDVPITTESDKNNPSNADDVTETSTKTERNQSIEISASLVRELEQLIEESNDKKVLPNLVDNDNPYVQKHATRSSAKSGDVGEMAPDNLAKVPSRKSNRIRSMNQRQIKSKTLLDRIKQIKRMDINGSLNNNTDLAGKSRLKGTREESQDTKLKIPISSNNTSNVGRDGKGIVIKTEETFPQLSSSIEKGAKVDRTLFEDLERLGIRNVAQAPECNNSLQEEEELTSNDQLLKSTETSYSTSVLMQALAGTQKSPVPYQRRNDREKPFKCNQCSYAAVEKRSLIIHQRKHSGERPFKCTFCPYAALHKSSLVVHMRKHTGEKPFKCTLCPYEAIQKGNLLVHLRKHSGEKPFKCSHCSFAAVEKRALTRHQRTHSGEKPFKCNLCSQEFARKDYLHKHYERTHFKNESVEGNTDDTA